MLFPFNFNLFDVYRIANIFICYLILLPHPAGLATKDIT